MKIPEFPSTSSRNGSLIALKQTGLLLPEKSTFSGF